MQTYKKPTPENLAKARCSKCHRIGGLVLKQENLMMQCNYCKEKYYKKGVLIN